jgi:hypothetical protein
MELSFNSISATALGIALAACCGFRVFVPLLIAGLAGKFQMFQFAENFGWMSTTPALIGLGAATLLEIGGYYIPIVDNFLDTISAPAATVAGTLLATSVIPIETDWMRWMIGIIAGGGGAGILASGMGILRLFSSKTTLGAGNAVVSTTENAAAIGGSLLSFLIPIVMAVLLLLLAFWIGGKVWRKLVKKQPSVE